MQKKSIRTYLAVSMAALASFALVNPMPAMAATEVEVVLEITGVEGADDETLTQMVSDYLEAGGLDVVDEAGDDGVTLNIQVHVDDDGEGIEYSMEWDSDGDAEDTDEVEEVDDIDEAFQNSLDEFIEDVKDGNVDDDDNADADEEDGEDEGEDDGDEE